MRVVFALGSIGPIGTAQNLVRIAQHAEALVYDSLWTVERLLWPVAPPGSPGVGPSAPIRFAVSVYKVVPTMLTPQAVFLFQKSWDIPTCGSQ